jgi:putative peptide zinc metalloprotease protein
MSTMLRREAGPTFSDLWYRVESTRPRLSPHAHVSRQFYADAVSFIIEDPAGSTYYRASEPAAFFLGLLDGKRTVGDAWDACVAQRGDEAPTQRECLDLLGKLQLYGLLLGELPLAPDMVEERKRQSRQKKLARVTGRGLFPTLPLINPEPFLERHRRFVELCFSKWGLLVWLAVVGVAAYKLIVNRGDLASAANFVGLLAPDNLLLLSAAFLVMRSLHELGHAAACKARGGRVTEIGLMLIAFVLPIPYCDASSSWKFVRTRDRVLVAAAGVIVEMFFAAIAAIVWSTTDTPWLTTLCFNIMVLSSVTTLVFNLNPLLRYDGYYILSDLLGIPNLAQKSRQLWQYMVQRVAFGVRAVRPPEVRSRAEAWTLGVYGLLATPYRLFVMVSILFMIASRYLGLGMALAAVLIAVWVAWPVMKGIGFLMSSPQLVGHRPRAWGVTLAALGVVLFVLGVVPAPAGSVAIGVIEASVHKPVRVAEAGFLVGAPAAPGARVEADRPLFVLESPELMTDLAMARARVKKAQAQYAHASLRGTRSEERVAAREVQHFEAERDRILQRVANLELTAPAPGSFVVANPSLLDPSNLQGRYFKRGTLLGYVSSVDDLIVRVAVSDKEAAYLFRQSDIAAALRRGMADELEMPVRIRVPGEFGQTIHGRSVRRFPAGSRDLPQPSLGTAAGGDIAPDPDDTSGQRTLVPLFMLEIKPDSVPKGWKPGLRARVRFDLPKQPLLTQWWRTAQQYVKGRLG